MAPPTHASQLARCERELARSKQWRQDEGYDDLWRRMVDLYRGKHFESESAADRIVVNMAFATINVISPSVAVTNPKFSVAARHPDSAPHAFVTEEVLNYTWRANKYKRQFRRAVDDFLMIGHGWLKCGYKFVQEPVVKGEVESDYADEGVADRDPTVDGNVESEMRVVDDRPFIERISFYDIFVDPDARHMDEIRWIAQRVRRPLPDVRKDERYNKKVRSKVTGTYTGRYDDTKANGGNPGQQGADPAHSDLGWVDVYEYYDVVRNRMCVFADGQDQSENKGFLIAPKKIDYAFGHPFLMLRNYDIPDFFYPMGELEAMEELQHELNGTRTQLFQMRRKYARKSLYMEEAFDEEGLAKLESDDDNTLVPVKAGVKIGEAIGPMPAEQSNPELYNQSDLIKGDINAVTATDEYLRGDAPNIRRTATEAAMIQDASNARAADKLSTIEEFLGEVGERLIQLLQQYMTGDQVVRIVGTGGLNTVWIKFDKDYIQGQFDFEVEGGSTQPSNESGKRLAANQMMDALSAIDPSVLNWAEVGTYLLRQFGVKSPERFILQPAPMGAPMPPGTPQDPAAMGMMPPQDPAAMGMPPIPPGLPPEMLSMQDPMQGAPQGAVPPL